MDVETEIAELRRQIELQRIALNGTGGAMVTLFDVFAQVLELRGVAERSRIAGRLRDIVAAATAETDADADVATQLTILAGFADQLDLPMTTEPPPRPTLRLVNNNSD